MQYRIRLLIRDLFQSLVKSDIKTPKFSLSFKVSYFLSDDVSILLYIFIMGQFCTCGVRFYINVNIIG